MSSPFTQFCDLISDLIISNAMKLQERFKNMFVEQGIEIDPDFLLKTFCFMNWTIVTGLWSNIEHAKLRRDLQAVLKDKFILKLAHKISGSDSPKDIAARAVFLTEDFQSYLKAFIHETKELGFADDGTSRLFALERIQEQFDIDDHVMNDVVPNVLSDEKLIIEVGDVAMQLNKAYEKQEKKGFFRKLFGF